MASVCGPLGTDGFVGCSSEYLACTAPSVYFEWQPMACGHDLSAISLIDLGGKDFAPICSVCLSIEYFEHSSFLLRYLRAELCSLCRKLLFAMAILKIEIASGFRRAKREAPCEYAYRLRYSAVNTKLNA